MVRMSGRPFRLRPVVALVLMSLAGLHAGRTAHAAALAVALPDTGLFAPVARQARARLAALVALPKTATPERVRALIEAGRPDEAWRLAQQLSGTANAVLVARARAAMAVEDLAAAAPIVAKLKELVGPGPDERATVYRWEVIRDDAPTLDALTSGRLHLTEPSNVPELLAAGRLAYDRLDYPRADSLFTRALSAIPPGDVPPAMAARATAHVGRALVMQKRRDWDGSLAELKHALDEHVTSDALETLANTLIRLGRTDEAISACEWGVRLDPYHDPSHYLLGNGYARKNYTQLVAAYPAAFADSIGRAALTAADAELGNGRRDAARTAYTRIVAAHPDWVDARIRLASLDFEDGRFPASRDGCFAALERCPEYGRAHAVLAKALESQRFEIDVHRADYERRFAAQAMPDVQGIDRFVVNWRALSPRHQKRVALSVAPWKAFVPVLVDGGATFFIKPLYMQLSECPDQETLKDQRISYDSRLWDDVRGCGGFHTVTGIEDVERTIFDRYNTVTHELTHQVHAVLPADDDRVIQELYRKAKTRDDSTHDGFLSRYAGGSVFEYFAEGANARVSPRRDAYDPREIVLERLQTMDPDLLHAVDAFLARTDVHASVPVALAAGGDDRVSRGEVEPALPLYRKALAATPDEESVMISYANALLLGGHADSSLDVAIRAVHVHPASGPARLALAEAERHHGVPLTRVRVELEAARGAVRAEDRYQIDGALGAYAWTDGDATASLAAYDSLLAYQSDSPEGLQGRATALALAGRDSAAFALYDEAVRVRTGIVDLRSSYAFDLLWAGRTAEAEHQLDEAKLLDVENPTAEALRGWAALARGDLVAARAHVTQALAWGPWSDLAQIVAGGIATRAGDPAAAKVAWTPVRERIAKQTPPEWVFRPRIASWEHVHVLPASERRLLDRLAAR